MSSPRRTYAVGRRGAVSGPPPRPRRFALSLVVTTVVTLLAVPSVRAGTGAVKGIVTGGPSAAPVANAVVLIEGPSVPPSANAPHAVMEQRNDTFVPRALVIVAGTTVDFPNSDPKLHNVFAMSSAKKFDLGMYDKGESKSVTFETPGVVPVRCNVHPKMEAFIVVHANPYAAVTDADGSYTITGVPEGSYDVRVWHEGLPEKRTRVTVRDGQVQPLDLRLEAGR